MNALQLLSHSATFIEGMRQTKTLIIKVNFKLLVNLFDN